MDEAKDLRILSYPKTNRLKVNVNSRAEINIPMLYFGTKGEASPKQNRD
jgi:hypothetical protein